MLTRDVQRHRDLSMYYEGVLSTQDLVLGLHQPGCILPRIVYRSTPNTPPLPTTPSTRVIPGMVLGTHCTPVQVSRDSQVHRVIPQDGTMNPPLPVQLSWNSQDGPMNILHVLGYPLSEVSWDSQHYSLAPRALPRMV